MNKITCNSRLLLRLEEFRVILYEVIRGKREKSSEHVSLNKKLVCDIGNQNRRPSVVTYGDATNFYDRIAYMFASMTNQHFGVQLKCLLVLFATAQSIKMLLRVSYGFSERFCT